MSQSAPEIPTSTYLEYQRWRERFLQVILYITAGIGTIFILYYIFVSPNTFYNTLAVTFFGLYLLLAFLKIPYAWRATIFIGFLYLSGLSALLDTSISSRTSILFLGFIILSAIILSPKAGWVATGLTIVTYAVIGWLFLSGYIKPWTSTSTIQEPTIWTQVGLYTLLLSVISISAISLLDKEILRVRQRASNALADLQEEKSSLATRVREATEELTKRATELENANRNNARRAAQFEAIAQTISSILSLRSLDQLLPYVTKVIGEQFGFYHVGLFLNDPEDKYTFLMAASSLGGKRMLERQHRLKIGEQGIVGYVAKFGQPRIALNVGEDAVYFDNPDLPDTKSELALPLKIGERIIGVLDVQSTEVNAFDQEDVRSLTILANQISLAIENARLFEQTSRSLAEAETLYRQYLQQGWFLLGKEEKIVGFRYTEKGIEPITQNQERLSKKETPNLEVPVALRGATLGRLTVKLQSKEKLRAEQIDIINAVAERIALAAENARLFTETARRAERERTVSQITTHIRATTDADKMIQTALEELKRALGAAEVSVRPYTESIAAEQPRRGRKSTKSEP